MVPFLKQSQIYKSYQVDCLLVFLKMAYRTIDIRAAPRSLPVAEMLKEYRGDANAQPSKLCDYLFFRGVYTGVVLDAAMSSGSFPVLHGLFESGKPLESAVWLPLGKCLGELCTVKCGDSPAKQFHYTITTLSTFYDKVKEKNIYYVSHAE